MHTTTCLVFGATGAVGRFLLPRLLATGARVHAVSRDPLGAAASVPRADWIAGDLFRPGFAVPDDAGVVVSLGPLDAFAGWFEQAAPARVRRVLALSSMSAESKQASPDAAERELAVRLCAAEERLAGSARLRGVDWTILRPTLIYGGGDDRSLAPIARFARRWRVLPIPLGAGGLRQPVHAEDLANALLAALDSAAAANRTYPVGGGERLRFDQLLWRLRAALPGFVLPVPLPLGVLGLLPSGWRTDGAGAAAVKRLREPLLADNTAAERDFGYAPRAFAAAEVLPGPRAARRH